MSKPKLAIVLITYKRTKYTLRTIQGVVDNMDYPRMWYVADDGSPEEHMEAVIGLLRKNDEEIIGQHNHRYSPNCGVGFNWAIKNCLEHSDYVMFLEDDWVLSGNYDMNEKVHPGKFNINPYIRNGRFNPTPYMELLAEREDVGMVRLGGIAVGNTVELVGHSGHHYLKYLREQQYAYSGNPHIRHRRFMDAYGYFSEKKLNPGELELEFDGRFRAASGPDIWRPYDIPGWGIFFHIGEARYR